MNLSKRLMAVASFLELPTAVADIGTDHAYLPIYLAQKSAATEIIAVENKVEPYNMAQQSIKRYNLTDRIELRLGSGLAPIKIDEIQSLTIAGMGATNMRQILTADYQLAQQLERIVLQPMAGADKLRQWLVANNFRIVAEKLVREGEIYQILLVEPGQMEEIDPFLLEIGPKLVTQKDPLLKEYLLELKSKWQRIVTKIEQNKVEHPKVLELKIKLEKIDELLGKEIQAYEC